MIKIDIICVGKVKEQFMQKAVDEYRKRLSRYADINILEVADEPTPENISIVEQSRILSKEGERIIRKISSNAYVTALAIDGESMSSEEFAGAIANLAVSGVSHIQFIIGGSLGIASEVYALCNAKVSFSKMTFPHQLMRVILFEQIYRAFRINNNEPYHK